MAFLFFQRLGVSGKQERFLFHTRMKFVKASGMT